MGTPSDRISEGEYLVRERAAEYKSEYLAGRVRAMVGASRAHNLITVNVAVALHAQLRGRPCEVYASDMRVKVVAAGIYTYPDITVVCGRPVLEDAHADTLLNPTVLFEVLSPSTAAYDRGEKFDYYRRLESLREFVLVAQDRLWVEHFVRDSGRWAPAELRDADSVLELPAIDCALRLADIYERLELPALPG